VSARPRSEDVPVALLRGVNVGGKHRLPMKDLASILEKAGCRDVRTYIQSGNAAFAAGASLVRRIPDLVSRAIIDRFGFESPVVLRSLEEMEAIARGNPFLRAGADERMLHVSFMKDRPAALRAASLDPLRSPPDEFVVSGREIYLRLPNGGARSRLTSAYLDSRLGTTTTVRNWRTVLALLDLARGA